MELKDRLQALLVDCEKAWSRTSEEVLFVVRTVQVEIDDGVKPLAVLMQHALCMQVETIIRLMEKGHMFEPYQYDLPRLWDMMTNFENDRWSKKLLKDAKADACKLNGFIQYGRYVDSDMHVFELFESFDQAQETLKRMYKQYHKALQEKIESMTDDC